jgi:hypothetical protein
MSVLVQFRGRRAILRAGEWRCCDVALEARLNQTMEQWIAASGGPELHSADPELDAAEEIARRFAGRVTGHIPAPPRAQAQTWFAKRQYKLAFM